MTPTAIAPRRLVEPTVLGAMRRHWLLVTVIVVTCADLALAFSLLRGAEYRASATLSAPRPAGSALQSDAQYLDSQVLLLDSRRVGDRAFEIATSEEAGAGIERAELAPTVGKVEIIPPGSDSSGGYGTTIVTIQFTALAAEQAQVGANALATAYDEVRSQEIASSAEARIDGIDRAIAAATDASDVAALRRERVQALIDQSRDLSQAVSISAAEKPDAPSGSGLLSLLSVGLCVGLVAGGAAAFVRANRLRHVGKAYVAARVYGAPLLWKGPVGASLAGYAELTERDRLMGRAVSQSLERLAGCSVLAIVASGRNAKRSEASAHLALALAEGGTKVLAVDGGNGTMAGFLRPGTALDGSERALGKTLESPLHRDLSVVKVNGPLPDGWGSYFDETHDRVVVVDCPSPASSARGVDLLSRSDAVVVLVRADEPVGDHVALARWLQITGTEMVGYVFTPYLPQGPRHWLRRRRARAKASGVGMTASPARDTTMQPAREESERSLPHRPSVPAPVGD